MKLTEVYLTGVMFPDAYRQKAHELQSKRTQLDGEARAVGLKAEVLRQYVTKALELATSMFDLYDQFSDTRRAELLHRVFRQVVIGADGVLGYTLRPPFDHLQDGTSPTAQATAVVSTA